MGNGELGIRNEELEIGNEELRMGDGGWGGYWIGWLCIDLTSYRLEPCRIFWRRCRK